jgi:hypothetical protein
MKERCHNRKAHQYPMYGGRGITVCDEWLYFPTFAEDMGGRPKGMSIDRIDNLQGYSKDNCKWSTASEQARNRRNNAYLVINGIRKTAAEWAVDYSIDQSLIHIRINRLGWSTEDAVTRPVSKKHIRKDRRKSHMTPASLYMT